jgi:succinate-semialdehyde dehydrogenase/glutarate-semialdehyde dehydrogenase
VSFRAVDPWRGVTLEASPALDDEEIERVVAAAHAAQRTWRDTPLAGRLALIAELGARLRAARDDLAERVTREMGKPITAARAEVDKCIRLCEDSLALAPRALAPEPITADATGAWRLEYQPLGVLLAIMPWNFPYWQALRVIVPNLLAGNAVLHKPAPAVPGSAARLHALLTSAAASLGAPPAIASLFLADPSSLPAVIADPRVAGVTLTGSERAGVAVAEAAGRSLKPVVLELGGSDAFIVLPDADIERAAHAAVDARLVNTGQSCIAAKRFIVCEARYEAFLAAFAARLRTVRIGDPLDPDTEVGPLASRAARDALAAQVDATLAAGARVHTRLDVPPAPAALYPPTILVDIPDGSPAADAELFGPVAAVFRVRDADAALARANATRFGLGASVWTDSAAEAARFIAELATGLVVVNAPVVSDPRVPFGGVKRSGMGRELGLAGLREFTNRKAVRVPT